jgi:hypothetical protein
MMVRPFLSSTVIIFSVLLVITTTVMQYLVWVMPEGFRKWLNRNQQTHMEEKIHERALAILGILGSAMSRGTGLSQMLAVYSIRKIIGQEIKTEDSSKIEARAIALGYDEWLTLLNDPELYIILKNAGPNIAPRTVLDQARHALIEKQSLFTMQVK